MSESGGDELHRVAARVARLLRERSDTLATAESCTGGMIAAVLTAGAGASDFYFGGAVVYTKEAKIVLAGIDPRVLEEHGPVSAPTTEALADGVRQRADSRYGLAVTGWAGPTVGAGGELGEVYVSVSDRAEVVTRDQQLSGDRAAIRCAAAVAALRFLLEQLEDDDD